MKGWCAPADDNYTAPPQKYKMTHNVAAPLLECFICAAQWFHMCIIWSRTLAHCLAHFGRITHRTHCTYVAPLLCTHPPASDSNSHPSCITPTVHAPYFLTLNHAQ